MFRVEEDKSVRFSNFHGKVWQLIDSCWKLMNKINIWGELVNQLPIGVTKLLFEVLYQA